MLTNPSSSFYIDQRSSFYTNSFGIKDNNVVEESFFFLKLIIQSPQFIKNRFLEFIDCFWIDVCNQLLAFK